MSCSHLITTATFMSRPTMHSKFTLCLPVCLSVRKYFPQFSLPIFPCIIFPLKVLIQIGVISIQSHLRGFKYIRSLAPLPAVKAYLREKLCLCLSIRKLFYIPTLSLYESYSALLGSCVNPGKNAMRINYCSQKTSLVALLIIFSPFIIK